jgi:hypothetical protein
MSATIDTQIKCVEREIAMRRRVYPKWVEAGRMSENKSIYEIATMEAVLETLKKAKAAEEPSLI